MQDEVGFVPGEGVGELRQSLDGVGEERLDVIDGFAPPALGPVGRVEVYTTGWAPVAATFAAKEAGTA